MKAGAGVSLKPRTLQIVAELNGQLEIKSGPTVINLSAGQFSLIPASLEWTEVMAKSDAALLRVEAN
jgi:mannose-6-phosphate isomerase class I